MRSEGIELTGNDEDVAFLNLGRAHCIDTAGKAEITRLLNTLAEKPSAARVLILHATHPEAWSVDIEELVDMPSVKAEEFSRNGHCVAAAIASLPIPVIAAVDAPALGGGCELVMACDLALAGEKAAFGQIEAMGGVMPAFGGTWRLEERVGYQRALAMMFTADIIDATKAKEYGLVLEVHPSKELLAASRSVAQRIARCRRASISAIKRVTRDGRDLSASERNVLEEEAFPSLFGKEQQTRMRGFLEQQRAK